MQTYAHIRKDLIEQGLSVPVGESFYHGKDLLKCQWIGDEIFFIHLNGFWQEAQSIDWDFLTID